MKKISEIKDQKVRELAELRRSQSSWNFSNSLSKAFNWDATPEKYGFWEEVNQHIEPVIDNRDEIIKSLEEQVRIQGEMIKMLMK